MPVTAGTTAMMRKLDLDECWRRIGVNGDRSCPALETHLHCRNCPTHADIARTLLDRPLPPGYREEWALHFARDGGNPALQDGGADGLRSVVLFRLNEEWLGLPTMSCHEVAEPRRIHSLPHRRNRAVVGIVNVRGELLICISLTELLGINDRGSSERGGRAASFRRLMVIGREQRRVAFEVDEVHGIHSYSERDRLEVPATIGRSSSTVTATMVSWRGHAVGCLDETLLLDTIDRSIA